MKYKLELKDIDFEVFRKGRGPGGQHKNKTATSIRATHKPTGIRVESCNERSQTSNKQKAIEFLQDKLDILLKGEEEKKKRELYGEKAESTFSSQIRTYRMCGNEQNVTDHVTGVVHNNPCKVLDGDIDSFLVANLKAGEA